MFFFTLSFICFFSLLISYHTSVIMPTTCFTLPTTHVYSRYEYLHYCCTIYFKLKYQVKKEFQLSLLKTFVPHKNKLLETVSFIYSLVMYVLVLLFRYNFFFLICTNLSLLCCVL